MIRFIRPKKSDGTAIDPSLPLLQGGCFAKKTNCQPAGESTMGKRMKSKGILPGFGLTIGYTLVYLSLLVLIPLSILFLQTASMTWEQFWLIVTDQRVLASFQVSFLTAFFAACMNAVFGVLVAWVLVRYHFPGKRFIDGIVDLPFALPTAVAGIALASIYSENGWIGQLFAAWGMKIAYTPVGIFVALTFIGLPFVVRTVQPVLQDWDRQVEEAAATLGASRLQTFLRVILPHLLPAILTALPWPLPAPWANTAPSSSSRATCRSRPKSFRF